MPDTGKGFLKLAGAGWGPDEQWESGYINLDRVTTILFIKQGEGEVAWVHFAGAEPQLFDGEAARRLREFVKRQ